MSFLHHVSLPVRDLDRSRAFYRDIIGLTECPRPPFSSQGAWFAMGDHQMHLILNPDTSFRTRPLIDTIDIHHAYCIPDFEAAVNRLSTLGYKIVPSKGPVFECTPDDLMYLLVDRGSPAGFLQAFLLDPDWHIVELNDAPQA